MGFARLGAMAPALLAPGHMVTQKGEASITRSYGSSHTAAANIDTRHHTPQHHNTAAPLRNHTQHSVSLTARHTLGAYHIWDHQIFGVVLLGIACGLTT